MFAPVYRHDEVLPPAASNRPELVDLLASESTNAQDSARSGRNLVTLVSGDEHLPQEPVGPSSRINLAAVSAAGRARDIRAAGADNSPVPGFDLLGWIVIGLLAGSISGWFVGTRSVQGCLPTIVVGILGGIVGGWLARELGYGQVEGFFGALVFAIIGSIVVRVILRALESRP